MIRLLSKLFKFVLFIIICTPTVSFAVISSGRNVNAPLSSSITNFENTLLNDLIPPSFDFQNRPTYKPCGNEIVFSYDNTNEGAATEIWRSRSADSDFVLVSVRHGEDMFIDQNLSSNKTYYYKLRAVKNDNTSEFSDVAGFESGAKWFDPTLELTLPDDHTVEGTLTDRSYLEYSYQISYHLEGGAPNELRENVMLSDSGQTFIFTHKELLPGRTYIYTVDAQLDWSCGSRLYSNVATDTITMPGEAQDELSPPVFAFDIPLHETCGNELVFALRNKNEGSSTEIWRSRHPESGFEKIRVFGDGTIEYIDDSLASRKDYYYKARAITSTDTSEFSETHKFTSGAKWFVPTLELTILPDNTIKGTFTDRSYLDDSYDFIRSGDGDNNLFHEGAVLTDSGRVFTFIDTATNDGETYSYHVDLYYCRANMLKDVLVESITIPDDGLPEGLMAPDLYVASPPAPRQCGNEIVFVIDNNNSGADTEIWRSRQPNSGFELIDVGQLDGPYVDDSLSSRKDYYYTLRAVTATDTSEFSTTYRLRSGAQWFEPTLELTVLPDNTVQGTLVDRSYLDAKYEVYRLEDFHSTAVLTDSGEVHTFIDTFVEPGETYTYHVDLHYCYTNVRKDVVSESISIPPEVAETAARVSVYPNPVANRATVQISGKPNETAYITLIDTKGETLLSTKELLPESGRFNGEIDLQDLRSGLYYMNVEFEGDSFSERILITD